MSLTRKSRQLLAEKFSRAKALHQKGEFVQARSLYLSILELQPDHAETLHFLGFLSYQTGDSEASLQLIRKSLQLQPSNIAAINNLGNVLLDRGELIEAEACYRQVIEQQPQAASNFCNLCVVLRQQGRLEEAIAAGRTAVRLEPGLATAWYSLGNVYKVAERLREAIDCYQRCIELDPQHPVAHDALCQVTHRLESKSFLGRRHFKKTIRAYQQWLASDPKQPLAVFMLKALQGGGRLTRAPDDVIRAQFNQAAGHFESRLEKLGYRVPALVGDAVQHHLGEARGDLKVLDGGCGTGLCAPMLRPYAAALTGVDLSAEMMKQAAASGLYDELIEQELTSFVQQQSRCFDLAVYADTLCYFGNLDEVLKATAGALREQGSLLFTVEKATVEVGYYLHPRGRYAHSESYVETSLRESGFSAVKCREETLRLELGKEVTGLVVTARIG